MQLQDEQKQKEFLKKYQNINRKMEEEQAQSQSLAHDIQYLDLSVFPIDLNAIALLDQNIAQDISAVIFYKDGSNLKLGTTKPDSPALKAVIEDLKKKHRYEITKYFISQSSLEQVLKLYSKVAKVPDYKEEAVTVVSGKDYEQELKNVEEMKSGAFNATKVIADIFGRAGQVQASDIHLEPEEHFIKLRFRVDGVLMDAARLPKDYQQPLISRIKILSKLKLNVTNVPQDGRLTYESDGNPVDVRVSVLPSARGEGIVMRILGNSTTLKLDDLGLTPRSANLLKAQLEKPNGMIITTGPTGSGKTTTLYAFLNQLNQPGVKIITLEDPVEFKLEGISQTPIDARSGLDFAAGLRAILRQDPDVVMVGEIRDEETANVALQAALTGHIVLSTLHTNDSASTIPRLVNMGVKPFVIAPAISSIIGQRLVRKLCVECKKQVQPDPFTLDRIKKILNSIPKSAEVSLPRDFKFYHSEGCKACHQTGYKGRVGIYEVLVKTESLEKLILSETSATVIKQAAIKEGMVTMVQDGLLKALAGITDVEEVFRVTQE